MQHLIKNGGEKKIIQFSKTKKPILGICLGMQILATLGDESGPTDGLNLIPGKVKKINTSQNQFLPHIGWNSVKILKNHPILEGVKNEMDFYFVHSYKFCLENKNHSIAQSFYTEIFNSIVKSQKYGLKILKNFCNWKNECWKKELYLFNYY